MCCVDFRDIVSVVIVFRNAGGIDFPGIANFFYNVGGMDFPDIVKSDYG